VLVPDPIVEVEPGPARAAWWLRRQAMLDLDDLDTPAYLRQGRLLN
jgi:hypothetical protein